MADDPAREIVELTGTVVSEEGGEPCAGVAVLLLDLAWEWGEDEGDMWRLPPRGAPDPGLEPGGSPAATAVTDAGGAFSWELRESGGHPSGPVRVRGEGWNAADERVVCEGAATVVAGSVTRLVLRPVR